MRILLPLATRLAETAVCAQLVAAAVCSLSRLVITVVVTVFKWYPVSATVILLVCPCAQERRLRDRVKSSVAPQGLPSFYSILSYGRKHYQRCICEVRFFVVSCEKERLQTSKLGVPQFVFTRILGNWVLCLTTHVLTTHVLTASSALSLLCLSFCRSLSWSGGINQTSLVAAKVIRATTIN
jgi:hypothetical protein